MDSKETVSRQMAEAFCSYTLTVEQQLKPNFALTCEPLHTVALDSRIAR